MQYLAHKANNAFIMCINSSLLPPGFPLPVVCIDAFLIPARFVYKDGRERG